MKKLALLAGFLVLAIIAFTQQPDSASAVTAIGKNVKIIYGRPSKGGKQIFGDQVPYGQVWKVGVNNPTKIIFSSDGSFGGLPVKAGTYNLFAIPNEKEWTIILNSASINGGDFKYEEIKDKDVLKVNVPVIKLDNVVEKLTCRFTETHLVIEWDQTQVAIPVNSEVSRN